MRIRIQEQGSLPKLPNKPDIHPIKKASLLFVAAKSDQDPDPHESAFVCRPFVVQDRIGVKRWIRILIETNADLQHWCFSCILKYPEPLNVYLRIPKDPYSEYC
jgi:hypothetical protein